MVQRELPVKNKTYKLLIFKKFTAKDIVTHSMGRKCAEPRVRPGSGQDTGGSPGRRLHPQGPAAVWLLVRQCPGHVGHGQHCRPPAPGPSGLAAVPGLSPGRLRPRPSSIVLRLWLGAASLQEKATVRPGRGAGGVSAQLCPETRLGGGSPCPLSPVSADRLREAGHSWGTGAPSQAALRAWAAQQVGTAPACLR